jgi:hypothetical protein
VRGQIGLHYSFRAIDLGDSPDLPHRRSGSSL